jgi:hypothetical protein
MIVFEEARQIALDFIGPDHALLGDVTLEKPYGWFFRYGTKSGGSLIGPGGFIVDREDGHVCEFSAAYPLERNLAAYEAGFKYRFYDLTVTSVANMEQSVEFLYRLDMQYVSRFSKRPKQYKKRHLRALLKELPCTFYNQHFYFRVEVFWEIDSVGCCRYQLRKHAAEGKNATQQIGYERRSQA